jgi:hypothetical protein
MCQTTSPSQRPSGLAFTDEREAFARAQLGHPDLGLEGLQPVHEERRVGASRQSHVMIREQRPMSPHRGSNGMWPCRARYRRRSGAGRDARRSPYRRSLRSRCRGRRRSDDFLEEDQNAGRRCGAPWRGRSLIVAGCRRPRLASTRSWAREDRGGPGPSSLGEWFHAAATRFADERFDRSVTSHVGHRLVDRHGRDRRLPAGIARVRVRRFEPSVRRHDFLSHVDVPVRFHDARRARWSASRHARAAGDLRARDGEPFDAGSVRAASARSSAACARAFDVA